MNFQIRSCSTFRLTGKIQRVSLCGAVFLMMALALRGESYPPQGRLITNLAVAVNPVTHKVYTVDTDAGMVSVTDERTGSIRTVKVGVEPTAIAVNPITNKIYVVNAGSGSVSVLNGTQDSVVTTLQGKPDPYVIAVNKVTNKIYVTHTYSDMAVVDGETNSAQMFKVGSADGIAIDPLTNAIFLMTYEDPKVRIVDGMTGAMSKVAVGPHLWGMAFDEALSTLYLAHTGTNDIVALNEKTHGVSTISVGDIPCAVAINPVTQKIYVANYGDGTVSVIDAVKEKVVATVSVGKKPQAIAVDQVHNRIYVANTHSDSVTAIDGAKNIAIGTYAAGRNPYALVVDPVFGRVYAANYGEPSATAIDVSRISTRK